MGVVGLWQILSEVGELWSLSEDEKTTLAVDLSAWIFQAKNANIQKKSSHYFIVRTVFYRTVELLRCGVKLVFVLDGVAPELKLKTLQKRSEAQSSRSSKHTSTDRQLYKTDVQKVEQLLRGLGQPVVQSPGEAEKMCAYLNSTKVVDGVLTDDSDAFLYGARKIYRHYEFQEKTATSVDMDDIEEALHLDRRSLIAFALLSGCDYNERGVKGMGPDHIKDLFQEMKSNCDDILDRICGWEENEHLQKLNKLKTDLDSVERTSHCSRCDHTGTVQTHRSKGCDTCKTERGCTDDCEVVCRCTWHGINQQIALYRLELKTREKALEVDNFTQHCQKIVKEFTSVDAEKARIAGMECLTPKHPNLKKVCDLLSQFLNMDKAKVVTTLIPVFARMQMKKEFDWPGFQPISIEKTCKRNFVECYQTTWSKLAEDVWTTDDSYTVDVEKEVFEENYPQIVTKFQQSSVKKKKRTTPANQKRISDMFMTPDSVRKKSRGPPEPETTPKEDGSQGRQLQRWKKKLDFSSTETSCQSGDGEGKSASCKDSTNGRRSKTKSKGEVSDSDEMNDMDSRKVESQESEKHPMLNNSSSQSTSQEGKTSGETDVHSLKSEDLFVSDDECEEKDRVIVSDSDGDSVCSVDRGFLDDPSEGNNNQDSDLEIIDKASNEAQRSGNDNCLSDRTKPKSGQLPEGLSESEDESQTHTSVKSNSEVHYVASEDSEDGSTATGSRLKPEEHSVRLPRRESNSSSGSDSVLLISSGDSGSSLPSLNSSNSSDVVLLDSNTDKDQTVIMSPSTQKRKSTDPAKEPAKKVKDTKQKGVSVKKKGSKGEGKQNTLRSYFSAKK